MKNCISLLVLLDLSAAFDTIDHDILIDRLQNYTGIQGQALRWFRSFSFLALKLWNNLPNTVREADTLYVSLNLD